jgi:hypothetical protein
MFSNYSNVLKTPLPNRVVSAIAVDPANSLHVYAGFQGYSANTPATPGHIFMSTNGGTAWSNVSGDLPDIPVNKLLIDPDNISHILAATDLGVFETTNGGTDWVTMSRNGSMPNVAVFDLAMRQFDRIVLAGTHGRGMYQLTAPLAVREVLHEIPNTYALGQNYPNPFNPSTTIPFSIAAQGKVTIIVYDEVGREIATLIDRRLAPGSYTATFDGTNVASGVYFYRLLLDNSVNQVRKMTLIR